MSAHQQISLQDIPASGLEDYIRNLAKKFNVTYIKTYADQWAEAVTKLADDDVQSDDVENTVIALYRKGIISGRDMTTLIISYLREKDDGV